MQHCPDHPPATLPLWYVQLVHAMLAWHAAWQAGASAKGPCCRVPMEGHLPKAKLRGTIGNHMALPPQAPRTALTALELRGEASPASTTVTFPTAAPLPAKAAPRSHSRASEGPMPAERNGTALEAAVPSTALLAAAPPARVLLAVQGTPRATLAPVTEESTVSSTTARGPRVGPELRMRR